MLAPCLASMLPHVISLRCCQYRGSSRTDHAVQLIQLPATHMGVKPSYADWNWVAQSGGFGQVQRAFSAACAAATVGRSWSNMYFSATRVLDSSRILRLGMPLSTASSTNSLHSADRYGAVQWRPSVLQAGPWQTCHILHKGLVREFLSQQEQWDWLISYNATSMSADLSSYIAVLCMVVPQLNQVWLECILSTREATLATTLV